MKDTQEKSISNNAMDAQNYTTKGDCKFLFDILGE